MSFPATIRPEVGQSLITKVSRLFNGTLGDVLQELFQNARRAGARAIHVAVYNLPTGSALSIYDDGCGIDDPANLLTLGTSGWQQDVRSREDPAGMGVFSLAGRDVLVRSWSRPAGRGWAVHIPADGWEGAVPLAIEPCGIVRGTEIQIMLPAAWEQQLASALRLAARYFPLPVHFEGAQLPCEDFLAGAGQIKLWEGCRIGIFHDSTTEAVHTPRINFHGVTVAARLPTLSEIERPHNWRVRIDIVDAPALQLVLPARKEMVENEALSRLGEAAEIALYRAIACEKSHRLSYKAWARARDLGVVLPEAEPWLNAWTPNIADTSNRYQGEAVRSGPMIIMSNHEPDIEQALSRALAKETPLGGRLVHENRDFEGYRWYDGLPRLLSCSFVLRRDGTLYRYADDVALPDDFEPGPVEDLFAEILLRPGGPSPSEPTLYRVPADMLVCNNGCWTLDEATILFDGQANVQPDALADLIYASLFCYSDDCERDSWDTQSLSFEHEARNLANLLLLGEDEALLARLREAVFEHVQWLIPSGRSLTISADKNRLSLSLDQAA
ncbi:ATP-binding protein [Sphingomonas sp. AP4-R1]|uniref:ATP-binding protein n=1 Tax=Sphingomonas sp. AP4-R1 TaxID=2735134 RepID=UPI001493A001|nr:ATP-binding protein [Sphingomonas sp. AP4-R1]QJU58465.1 ATP-binding protein [Sphingomonas sp. AP4-R1]